MESMSSNLKASLPLNVDEDTDLTDRFKDSALAITALFKHAQRSRRTAFAQGYTACVSDLRDFIRSNVRTSETDKPLTVGAILDFLESRQTQLSRDVDFTPATSTNLPAAKEKSTQSRHRKSPSTTSIRTNNGSSRPRSPSTPLATSHSSPTPQPETPLREQSWSEVSTSDSVKPSTANWPEVSVLPVLSVLPAMANHPNSLPSIGGKRKRDSIVEFDPKNTPTVHLNATDHHLRRHLTSSRRRKGNSNKGGAQNKGLLHGGSDDWSMDMDEEGSGRERKRARG
ncbi:hypothetical protein FRC14_004828 [Serendipita sp. 396]|nr:hypothetical protein FRC14_004828 [Serendipita sp. 396]